MIIMNPELQRSRINSSKSRRRLQKRKRAHTVNLNDYRERKIKCMTLLMEWFALTGGQGKMLRNLIQMEINESRDPEIKALIAQPPTDVNYSLGILTLGPDNFLSAAVTFCHDVAREGRMTIVSVGCGDGSIEKKIAETYRERYGEHSSDLNIILVDPDPRYKVHFKYVDELIEKRPYIIGHCALFIIWPEPQAVNEGYDIEAIRKLQPRGVLTVYESGGGSGSLEYFKFLRGGNDLLKMPWSELGFWNRQSIVFDITEECESHGLDNYETEEVAIYKKFHGELAGTIANRMVVARRTDFEFVNVCPAINWTCKQEEMRFQKFISKKLDEGLLSEINDANRMLFNMESLGLTYDMMNNYM